MRKNGKLVLIITLLLLCVLSMTVIFSACDPTEGGGGQKPGEDPGDDGWGDSWEPNPDPEKPPTVYTSAQIFQRVLVDLVNSGAVTNIDVALEACALDEKTKKTDTYEIEFKGAIGAIETLQVVFSVVCTERSGAKLDKPENLFSLFVDHNDIYVQAGDKVYWLSDFDVIKLVQMLSGVIGDIDIDAGSIIDLLALMVFPMIFPGNAVETAGANGEMHYEIEADFAEFFRGLDKLVESALGEGGFQLPIKLELAQLFNFIAGSIPPIRTPITASFDSTGALIRDSLSFTTIDADLSSETNGEDLFSLRTLRVVSNANSTPADVGMPEFDKTQLDVFSLFNLEFAIDLMLGTRDADGNVADLDVGALINMFTGTDTLPAGLIMLNADYGVRIKVTLDLDVNFFTRPDPTDDQDNNMIVVELWQLDSHGAVVEQKPIAGVYYYDKAAYINLDNILPDAWNLRTIKLNTNLDAALDLISNYVQDLMDDAMKPSEQAASTLATASAPRYGSSDVVGADQIIPTNVNGNGDRVISPFVTDLFSHVFQVLPGLEEYISVGGDDGNSIRVTLNNGLLDFISNLMVSFGAGSLDFRLPEGIESAEISVNLDSEKGVDNIRAEVVLKGPDGVELDAKVQIGEFLIGLEHKGLREYIQKQTQTVNGEPTSKIVDVLKHALGMDGDVTKDSGILFTMQFRFGFNKGTYDLAPFIAGFGLDVLKNKHILWTFTENFKFDTELVVQLSLNEQDHSQSVLYMDLKSVSGIKIGDIQLMAPDTSILKITGVNNAVHVDLSNVQIAKIHLPKIKADIDFTEIVYNLLFGEDSAIGSTLGQLDLSFDLAGILEELLKKGNPDVETEADVANLLFGTPNPQANLLTDELTEAGKIFVLLNSESLVLQTSVQAVLALLKTFNVNLDTDKMPSLKTMDANLQLTGSRTSGISLDLTGVKLAPAVKNAIPNADGTVTLPVDENGQPVYEYDYDALGMTMHIETGSKSFPIQIGNITKWREDLQKITSANYDQYNDELIKLLTAVIGTANFRLDINMSTLDQQMNLTRIINNILASQGMSFDLPINLNLDRYDDVNVTMLLQWNLDLDNMVNTQFLMEFVYNDRLLFGLYMYRGSVVGDLRGLGLFNFEIVNSTLVGMITDLIGGLMDQLGGTSLSDIIANLLNPEQEIDLTGSIVSNENAAPASGTVTTIDENSIAQTLAEGGDSMDWIGSLLACVSGYNANITLAFGAKVVDELFRNLLGFGLGVDLSLSGQLDAINGHLSFGMKVEEIDLKLDMQMEVGKQLNLNLVLGDVPDWDMSNSRGFVEDIFENLDIALMVDIANSTQITTNWGNQYTRLRLERVTARRTLPNGNGATANPGDFLITLSSVDYNRYNDTNAGTIQPLIYIVYTPKTASMVLTMTSGWLKINVLGVKYDLAGTIGAQTIPNVDLIGTIATALVNAGLFPNEQQPGQPGADQGGQQEPADATADDPMKEFSDALSALFDPAQGGMNILDLFGGGINISLRSTGVFNLDASLDGYAFNRVLDSVMDLLFGANSKLDLSKLAPKMFTAHHLRKITWNRVNPEAFWSSFWGAMPDLIKDLLTGIGQGGLAGMITPTILGVAQDTVKGLLTRLLPLPVVNDIHVGVDVVEGTFANLYVTMYDNNETVADKNGNVWSYNGVQYTASNGARSAYSESVDSNGQLRVSGYYTEIWMYNVSSSVGTPIRPGYGDGLGTPDTEHQGVVNWGDLAQNIDFDPYEYPALSDTVNGVPRAKTMLMQEYFIGKIAKFRNGLRVSKVPIEFRIVGRYNIDLDGNRVGSMTSMDASVDSLDLSKPAVYAIRAIANFDATIGVKTFDMYLAVQDDNGGRVASVGEMTIDGGYSAGLSMHAYDALPDTFYIELKDSSGASHYRQIRTDKVQFDNYAPKSYLAHEIEDASVRFANGVTLQLQKDMVNGVETIVNPGVTIHYLDSTAVDVYGGIYVPIDLYKLTLPKDENDAQALIQRYLPEILYFTYADGYSDKQVVTDRPQAGDAEYDAFYNALVSRDANDDNGGQYPLTLTIGTGALRQDVRLIISIPTKKITGIRLGESENEVRIDPYAYYLFQMTGDQDQNPFPREVQVTYYQEYLDADGKNYEDSYQETVYVAWDYDAISSQIKWDTSNNVQGNIKATIRLDKERTDEEGNLIYGGDFSWERQVSVILARNEIRSIYFDERMRPQDKTLTIDPYVFAANLNAITSGRDADRLVNFPSEAWVEFTNGSVVKLPIAWQSDVVREWDPSYSSMTNQFQVTIGHDVEKYKAYLDIAALNTGSTDLSGMLQSKRVKVVVQDKTVEGVNIAGSDYYNDLNLLDESYYYIDPLAYRYFGQSALPTTVEVNYTDGLSAMLPVVWHGWQDGDDAELRKYFTMNGSGDTYYTVRAIVSDRVSFDVKVKFRNRNMNDPEVFQYQNAITINPYAYTKNGLSRAYKEFTPTMRGTYREGWTLTYVNAANRVQEISFMQYEQAEMLSEKARLESLGFTVDMRTDYSTHDLPIEWDLSQLNYTKYGTYPVRMLLANHESRADMERSELAVTVTMDYRTLVGINSAPYADNEDGSIMLDESGNPIRKAEEDQFTFTIAKGGTNLTALERAARYVVRDYMVFLYDKTVSDTTYLTLRLSVRIELRGIDYNSVVSGTTTAYISYEYTDIRQEIKINYAVVDASAMA